MNKVSPSWIKTLFVGSGFLLLAGLTLVSGGCGNKDDSVSKDPEIDSAQGRKDSAKPPKVRFVDITAKAGTNYTAPLTKTAPSRSSQPMPMAA